MKIEHPSACHLPALKQLWMAAFEDTDAFVDRFFQVAFAPQRCLCLLQDEHPVAAAYWFDVSFSGKQAAYVYAVATDPDHRGRGFCRQLMQQLHQHLAQRQYAGAILVPGDPGLRGMYQAMGYADFGGIREFSCTASATPIPVREISAEEFARRRSDFLSPDSVIQEGENLAFLKQFYRFYATERHVFAAASTGIELFAAELLGNPGAAADILAAFGLRSGVFRVPGSTPYAMYHSLDGKPAPVYFAFAFD